MWGNFNRYSFVCANTSRQEDWSLGEGKQWAKRRTWTAEIQVWTVRGIGKNNLKWKHYLKLIFQPMLTILIGDRCAMQQVKQRWNILFAFILLLGWAENI